MGAAPKISVVVVNFNAGDQLLECLQSVLASTRPPQEVILVDNASKDGSMQQAESVSARVVVIRNDENVGFAAAANQGAQAATGDVLLFLNPDVVVSPTCLEHVSEALERSPGVVGTVVSLDADADDPYGCTIDRLGYPTGLRQPTKPLYIAGSALATPRVLFQRLGGFDARYFMFVEDVDYCWRVLLTGLEVSVCYDAQVTHRGGASAKGGYIRGGKLETTAFRFALRERNTLATLLKCAPAGWLAWFIPVHFIKTSALVMGCAVLGQFGLSWGLLRGLAWNVSKLPDTWRRRTNILRVYGTDRMIRRRIYRGWVAIEVLRKVGLPTFADGSQRSLGDLVDGGSSHRVAKQK